MKLKINNVRLSLLHDTPLEKAVCKKLGVPKDCVGEIKIVRKAVDARKKDNVCLNYHVLADVDVNNKFASKLIIILQIMKINSLYSLLRVIKFLIISYLMITNVKHKI